MVRKTSHSKVPSLCHMGRVVSQGQWLSPRPLQRLRESLREHKQTGPVTRHTTVGRGFHIYCICSVNTSLALPWRRKTAAQEQCLESSKTSGLMGASHGLPTGVQMSGRSRGWQEPLPNKDHPKQGSQPLTHLNI